MCKGLVDGAQLSAGDGVGATLAGRVHEVGGAVGAVVERGTEPVGAAVGVWDARSVGVNGMLPCPA